MSNTHVTPAALEKTVDRFSKLSDRVVKDFEKQFKMIDKRVKAVIDQGETVTSRVMDRLDAEFRSQLTSLRHEVERLTHQVDGLRAGLPMKATKPATRKPAAKKPAAKKAAAKKPAARKPAAKKASAKRVAA